MESLDNIAMLAPSIEPNFKKKFWKFLSRWYGENGFKYPWRKSPTPYSVLVSEFMLQQTQAETVVPYFLAWMEKFPDWESLAKAQEKEVLRAWEGLGYYSRARNLHRIAVMLYHERKGELPSDPEELMKFPGIGPYTANAVASLAFGRKTPALDGNVIRVMARLMNINQPIHKKETIRTIFQVVDSLMQGEAEASLFNSALMDFGRAVCKPKYPRCFACVLKEMCKAKQPELLPLRTKIEIEEKKEKIAIIREDDRFWLQQANSNQNRYRGLWLFPYFDPDVMEEKAPLFFLRHSFTRYKILLEVCEASWNKERLKMMPIEGQWVKKKEIFSLPLPSPHRKIWLQLLSKDETNKGP
ncbi:A/G-specific adenine glycosylase [Candidatus Methylacidiphilum infernorum]|uniref:Adenine DNA glycosylase n=1 Tax=Candidatus Methylacidiphilum infernorum TaxID=511746 RepID=A0ABX7PVH2_9BACT|nr:A/G-specific adenine glycosylase [Candidatus Methylacidiphilum infernorum]QSR87000.1 A/G-specific adenine glycosylase [Candidatus Methylacidiphilum infernorum]